jgi:hypothetical protein
MSAAGRKKLRRFQKKKKKKKKKKKNVLGDELLIEDHAFHSSFDILNIFLGQHGRDQFSLLTLRNDRVELLELCDHRIRTF